MKEKGNSFIIAIVAIVFIIFIAIWIYQEKQPEALNIENSQNIVKDPNTGFVNLANAIFEEEENHNAVENEPAQEEESIEPPTTDKSSEVIQEPTINKEEKAKQLVEQEWGDMEGFYLVVEGIDPEGRYRITVRDEQTALKGSYIVDVDKEKVTEL